jgi:CelD/BcsL family acetyltransferase involved in cellulose biosynthesis
MKRTNSLTIRTLSSLDEFKGLATDWEQLLRTMPGHSLFLTWEWLYYWAKHFLQDNELKIILFQDHRQTLVGVAPLYIRTTTVRPLISVREFRFLGDDTVCSSYLDVIVSEGDKRAVLQRLYHYLFNEARNEWDILTLSDVPAESSSLDIWDDLLNEAGKVREVVAMTCCPVIRLPVDIESYRVSLGRNRRYSLQRKKKRLEAAGRIDYVRVTRPAEIDAAFESLIALHQQRWSAGPNGGVFTNDRSLGFHREIVRVSSERGWISLDLLLVDGQPVAAIYGFIYEGVYYFYLPGFNPKSIPTASPGLLLLAHRIEQAILEGAQMVDLLQGVQAYKLEWSTGLRRSVTCRYYNRHARASALKLFESAKQAVKILIR